MELEDLKKGWKELDEQVDKLEPKDDMLASRVTQKRVTSAHQRLKKEYQNMTALCFLAASWLPMIQRHIEELPLGVMGLFLIFFLIMAAQKGFIWWKLSHVDYKRMTVKEALVSTHQLEKYQKTTTLVGIVLAVPLLAFFVVELYLLHEMYAFYGAWCGLLIGLWGGLHVRRRIKREIKELHEALKDELNEL